jgi:hypothetical protein
MGYRCYSRRILGAFRGTLQVVGVDAGEAESRDGLTWTLYVMDRRIVTHTGLSELRYGTWSSRARRSRSRVRRTATGHSIEEIGDRLVAALKQCAHQVPFAPRDCHECWLLDETGDPLALLETAVHRRDRGVVEAPRWRPGPAAQRSFGGSGDAERLECLINRAAWRRPLETERAYRPLRSSLDPEGLRVARVKASLMRRVLTPQKVPEEPFLPFYLE